MRKGRKRFILLAVSCIAIFMSLSQEPAMTYQQLLHTFRQAQHWYDEATALGSSASYSEEKESSLNRKALSGFQDLLEQFPEAPAYDSLRFWTEFRTGELQHYFEQYDAALKGYSLAIQTAQKGKLPDSLLFKPLLYSGILSYNKNDYDAASQYFLKADSILKRYGRLEESERLYNTFGVLYYEKGDYRQAGNYFRKALELLPEQHPYYRELLVNYKINLAQIHFKLEDYDESSRIYQSLLPLQTNTNEINHNLGLINLYLGATRPALRYFRQVHYNSNKIIWLLSNMGEAFMNQEQYDSAQVYLDRALASSQEFGSNTDHVAVGLALKNYGDLKQRLQDHPGSLSYYHQALHRFYPAFSDTSLHANPQQFSGVFSYINLFNTLIAKAGAQHELYLQSKKTEWAIRELQTYESAFRLVAYVERTYESDEARLFLDKSKYIIHNKPIDIAFELYTVTKNEDYIHKLYQFDQQNKASILAIRRHAAQLHRNDSSLMIQEQGLKDQITRLTLKASRKTDSASIEALNREIRDREIELGRIQDRLSGNQGYSDQVPSIKAMQGKVLEKDAAILSYHLSEDKLTSLIITKTKIFCEQRALLPSFREELETYISRLKDPQAVVLDTSFHQLLLSGLPLENIQRLIIIPDDELHYLPFESLKDSAGRFLLEKFSIQYQYTTALLQKEKETLAGHQTLALAPFTQSGYTDSSIQFAALPHSAGEVSRIKGAAFMDTAASKANLLNNIARYKVLHLATHAIVNHQRDHLSFIALSPRSSEEDFLLFADEIYNLPLEQIRLVILSACETGSGTLVKGEGIMSLSRAFTYAGCPNIITSLWVANDLSTAYLAEKVHHYLNRNEPAEIALHKAKLDYLADKNISPRMKHPYYWSHLVFVGNYGVKPGHSNWPWLAGGIAIVALLSFLLIKKFRR